MSIDSLFTGRVLDGQKKDLPVLATKENTRGRTFIVTGANSGLGLEAARHYVSLGAAKVIMAARNMAAGEKARADVEATTKTSGIAEVWQLDLASYDSVKAFAARANTELERIDALIENAALALDRWEWAEGHESTTTINVYSTFLLAILLLPKLKASVKSGNTPHLVIVTSGSGFMLKDVILSTRDDLLGRMDIQEQFNPQVRYPTTKIVEIFAGRYLSTLISVSRTGVVLNYIDPGLCVTNLNTKGSDAMREFVEGHRQKYGARTAEMGSRTLLHAAVAGPESHGCLLASCENQDDRVPEWVTDEDGQKLQKQIWESIARELSRVAPGCVDAALA